MYNKSLLLKKDPKGVKTYELYDICKKLEIYKKESRGRLLPFFYSLALSSAKIILKVENI